MIRAAFLRSRNFYLISAAMWLASVLVLGTKGILVFPGLLLYLLPGFLVGEKLTGQLNSSNPAPLICAILLGMVLSGIFLLFSGALFGFSPGINLFSLSLLTLLATVFNSSYQNSRELIPPPPEFTRRDYYALLGAAGFLLLFILPAYLRVGQLTEGAHAYTQWFSLDFLLSKTYTAALSRTAKLPPQDPFFPKFVLRYHYFLHILPAYLYQLTRTKIDLEHLLLFLYLLADMVFLTSIYLLFAERLKQLSARIAAMLLLLVANSFEGLFFLYLQLGKGPLNPLLFQNLEMRFVPSLLTPYLHLLYIVPHLFTASYFYLFYVLLKKRGGNLPYLLAGLILGATSGMSIFMSLILAFFCLLLFFDKRVLAQQKGWLRVGIFIIAALTVSLWLGGVLKMFASPDLSAYLANFPPGQLSKAKKVGLSPGLYGLSRFSLRFLFGYIGPYLQIAAECWPALFFLFWAVYIYLRQGQSSELFLELAMALSLLFAYLFIAIGPANRLISHKISLMLYCFCALCTGRVLEASPRSKKLGWALLVIFTLMALPTLALNFGYIIKLDNPQEVTLISSADYQATQWIKDNLPAEAVIQCFPNYPAWPHQYSLIPMFAERDTGVGAFKLVRYVLSYDELTLNELRRVSALYLQQTTPSQARRLLDEYQIGYLYYGAIEKQVFGPGSLDYLMKLPQLYKIAYRQNDVVIFQVKDRT